MLRICGLAEHSRASRRVYARHRTDCSARDHYTSSEFPQGHTSERNTLTGDDMNWDTIEGNWKQLKGKLKEQWGKLTDDHLDTIDGKREQLSGKIQEAYGVSKDEADKQIDDFAERNKDHKAP